MSITTQKISKILFNLCIYTFPITPANLTSSQFTPTQSEKSMQKVVSQSHQKRHIENFCFLKI